MLVLGVLELMWPTTRPRRSRRARSEPGPSRPILAAPARPAQSILPRRLIDSPSASRPSGGFVFPPPADYVPPPPAREEVRPDRARAIAIRAGSAAGRARALADRGRALARRCCGASRGGARVEAPGTRRISGRGRVA